MPLDNSLVAQFAKATKKQNEDKETILYGTISLVHGDSYVILDGGNDPIPVSLYTSEISNGDRVTVMIKNHSLIVTGNLSRQAINSNNILAITTNYIQSLWDNYNN